MSKVHKIGGGQLIVDIDGEVHQISLDSERCRSVLNALRLYQAHNQPKKRDKPRAKGRMLTKSESIEAEMMWRHHWDLDRIAAWFGCSRLSVSNAINRVRNDRYDS